MSLEIDIDKVLKQKATTLYRYIPRFVINGFARYVHQNEINQLLNDLTGLEGIEFLEASLKYLGVKFKFHGAEKIPPRGNYIFAGNHPLGGLDGMILMQIITQNFGHCKTMSNDILMNIEPLKSFFVPINKHGVQSVEYARLIDDMYSSDANVLIFPAGLCSRKINGKITDLEWKTNFVKKAQRYKRDIIPFHVVGKNSDTFYNVEKIRKFLGVKINIGMLMLPNELFKQKGSNTIEIYFGDVIPAESLSKDHKPEFWCAEIRRKSEQLAETVK